MAWRGPRTGGNGRPAVFSDAAIQFCLMVKVLFGLPLRQTTGMVESILSMAGLDWPVPDFSTLSRRQKRITVQISNRRAPGPLNLLVDSTGIKFLGEGEWLARKHGTQCRRQYRKVHLAMDTATGDIRAVEFTSSDKGDSPVLPHLLDQIPPDEQIGTVTGDGAFDTRRCHTAILERGGTAVSETAAALAAECLIRVLFWTLTLLLAALFDRLLPDPRTAAADPLTAAPPAPPWAVAAPP